MKPGRATKIVMSLATGMLCRPLSPYPSSPVSRRGPARRNFNSNAIKLMCVFEAAPRRANRESRKEGNEENKSIAARNGMGRGRAGADRSGQVISCRAQAKRRQSKTLSMSSHSVDEIELEP